MGTFLKWLFAIGFIFIGVAALSWIITCGFVKLICVCFGWNFNWAIATGIWLVLWLLKSVFGKGGNK